MGPKTHENWWKWNSWWISQRKCLTFTQNLSLYLVYLQTLAGEWSGTGQAGIMRSIGSSYVDKGRLGALLKTFCEKRREIAHYELRIMTVANRTLSFERAFIWSEAYKQCQVWQMRAGIWNGPPHSLWLWGFGHIKIQAPGSSIYETRRLCEDIPVSRLLHFVQGAGVLKEWSKGQYKRSITVEVHGSLGALPSVFYSFVF